jgi:DNA-binding transcriptional MerR regulator
MRIGQLGAATGTGPETIRFYEKEGLLSAPSRSASNYRSYGPEHVARLTFIRRLRDLGFPLEQVRELLSVIDGSAPSVDVADRILRAQQAAIELKIADLKALRTEFSRLPPNATKADYAQLVVVFLPDDTPVKP